MTSSTRELLVGDTSFVSTLVPDRSRRTLSTTWRAEDVHRVSSATVAISVVTFGEMRHGQQVSRWGARRVRAAERWLRSFVQFPVDTGVAEAWAQLKAAGQRHGRSFGSNDLWIAATGQRHGIPVVTCDRDFLLMRELGVQVIYLPRAVDSRRV